MDAAVTSESIDTEDFFAPASNDTIDMLIGQYQSMRTHIQAVADFMASDDTSNATRYFFRAQESVSSGSCRMLPAYSMHRRPSRHWMLNTGSERWK